MIVTTETARVYRGGGRRWFTRRAAYRAAAREKILARWTKRWGCECGDTLDTETGYVPPVCPTHGSTERLSRATDRLASLYRRADFVAGEACWYCRHDCQATRIEGVMGHYSTVQGSTDWKPCPNAKKEPIDAQV